MGTTLLERALRWVVLAAGALTLMLAPSCEPSELELISEVTTLRALAVQADQPYVQPGDELTLRLTYHDGFGSSPRPVQVTWVAGCVDPLGDTFLGCYPHLYYAAAKLEEAIAFDPFVQQELVPPELSGEPDGVTFTATVPETILLPKEEGAEPLKSAKLYVFFFLCAGTLGPNDDPDYSSLPLACYDDSGNPVGPDSFLPGFTEVYVFPDDRPNENPPILGLELDGNELAATPEEATVVKACPTSSDDQRGCGGTPEDCLYDLRPLVDDVAEPDPKAAEGTNGREVLSAHLYADAGMVPAEQVLISSALTGYKEKHRVEWAAPGEPGLVTFWAVVHDNRGGTSVTRRYVLVE
ncbi:MAG: hypothetical protein JRI68_16905 [Deltaproteobacteria bacterium]|nr:hypothetical protein [Deltaproteobacteria bacterium]